MSDPQSKPPVAPEKKRSPHQQKFHDRLVEALSKCGPLGPKTDPPAPQKK